MSWDDYELFLHVVRAGGIRAAARKLGTDHAAISRRVARLEEALGTKLLHRRSRGQLPTSAGQELMAAAEAMEAHAQQVERRVVRRDAELEGWVRVSCNLPLGLRLLAPMVDRFSTLYPGIELEVSLSQRLADLASNDADVALRVGLTPPDDVIAVRLCGFAVATYASTPNPTHWIGWDPDGPYDGFIKQTECVDLPVRHRFTEDLMLVEAAKQGLGAAVFSCMLGDAEPGLVRIGAAHAVASVFVLRHPDHRSTARIRAFVAFIQASFPQVADLIEGKRPQPRRAD